MSCEHLICAHCTGPVVEGRCAACRAARAQVHHHQGPNLVPTLLVAALIMTMLLMLAVRFAH